jgi:hypothetical protein
MQRTMKTYGGLKALKLKIRWRQVVRSATSLLGKELSQSDG